MISTKEYNKFNNLLRDKLSQATTDLDLQAKGIDEDFESFAV